MRHQKRSPFLKANAYRDTIGLNKELKKIKEFLKNQYNGLDSYYDYSVENNSFQSQFEILVRKFKSKADELKLKDTDNLLHLIIRARRSNIPFRFANSNEEKLFFSKLKKELEIIYYEIHKSDDSEKIKTTLQLFINQFKTCSEGVSGAIHDAFQYWKNPHTFSNIVGNLRIEITDKRATLAKFRSNVTSGLNVHINTNLASLLTESGFEVPSNDSKDPYNMDQYRPFIRKAHDEVMISYNSEQISQKLQNNALNFYKTVRDIHYSYFNIFKELDLLGMQEETQTQNYGQYMVKMRPILEAKIVTQDYLVVGDEFKHNPDFEKEIIFYLNQYLIKIFCADEQKLDQSEEQTLCKILDYCLSLDLEEGSKEFTKKYTQFLINKYEFLVDVDQFVSELKEKDKYPTLIEACKRGETEIIKKFLQGKFEYFHVNLQEKSPTEYIILDELELFSNNQKVDLISLFLKNKFFFDSECKLLDSKAIGSIINFINNFNFNEQNLIPFFTKTLELIPTEQNEQFFLTIIRTLTPSLFLRMCKVFSNIPRFRDKIFLSLIYRNHGFSSPNDQALWIDIIFEKNIFIPENEFIIKNMALPSCSLDTFKLLLEKLDLANNKKLVSRTFLQNLESTNQLEKIELILIYTKTKSVISDVLNEIKDKKIQKIASLALMENFEVEFSNSDALYFHNIKSKFNVENIFLLKHIEYLVTENKINELVELTTELDPHYHIEPKEYKSTREYLVDWLANSSINSEERYIRNFKLSSFAINKMFQDNEENKLLSTFAELKSCFTLCHFLEQYPQTKVNTLPARCSEANSIFLEFILSLSEKKIDRISQSFLTLLSKNLIPLPNLINFIINKFGFDDNLHNKIYNIIPNHLKEEFCERYPNQERRQEKIMESFIITIKNTTISSYDSIIRETITALKKVYHGKTSTKLSEQLNKVELISFILSLKKKFSFTHRSEIFTKLIEFALDLNHTSFSICNQFKNNLYTLIKYHSISGQFCVNSYYRLMKEYKINQDFFSKISSEKNFRIIDDHLQLFKKMSTYSNNNLDQITTLCRLQKLNIIANGLLNEFKELTSNHVLSDADFVKVKANFEGIFRDFSNDLKPFYLNSEDKAKYQKIAINFKLHLDNVELIKNGSYDRPIHPEKILFIKYNLILKMMTRNTNDLTRYKERAIKEFSLLNHGSHFEAKNFERLIVREFDIRIDLYKKLELLSKKYRLLQNYKHPHHNQQLLEYFKNQLVSILVNIKISDEEKRYLITRFSNDVTKNVKPPRSNQPPNPSPKYLAKLDSIYANFSTSLEFIKNETSLFELVQSIKTEIVSYKEALPIGHEINFSEYLEEGNKIDIEANRKLNQLKSAAQALSSTKFIEFLKIFSNPSATGLISYPAKDHKTLSGSKTNLFKPENPNKIKPRFETLVVSEPAMGEFVGLANKNQELFFPRVGSCLAIVIKLNDGRVLGGHVPQIWDQDQKMDPENFIINFSRVLIKMQEQLHISVNDVEKVSLFGDVSWQPVYSQCKQVYREKVSFTSLRDSVDVTANTWTTCYTPAIQNNPSHNIHS